MKELKSYLECILGFESRKQTLFTGNWTLGWIDERIDGKSQIGCIAQKAIDEQR